MAPASGFRQAEPARPEPALECRFAGAMARLGPWGPAPRIAVGVSGGADSLALALLSDAWARARGGAAHALIVDHGLRPEAAREAASTQAALHRRGIAADVLALGLGAANAARARTARLGALEAACARLGLLHLLLAHHALDQAETCVIRALDGSGPAGLAGMAALRHGTAVRIVRPLLGVPPAALRRFVAGAGLRPVVDPTNTDPRATRARIRIARADRDGEGAATRALVIAAIANGVRRAKAESDDADWLARHTSIRPEGFAILPPGPWPPSALARLIRAIGGRPYSPSCIAALAANPAPATRAGVRVMPAGRFGPGWMLVRETPPPAARAADGVLWGGMWRVVGEWPGGATVTALGDAARPDLPAVVRRVLPSIRVDGQILAWGPACAWFAPPEPACGAPFVAESAA